MSGAEGFPLRVEEILAATDTEYRVGQALPEATAETWQMVYLRAGMVEETCDTAKVALRQGGLLFHQPGEVWAMRAVGEFPPEVVRVWFSCAGSAMDLFRGRSFRAAPADFYLLRLMVQDIGELFQPPGEAGAPPGLRPDPPFAAAQLFALHLEQLLIGLARRTRRARAPSARARREAEQIALVDNVRLYFAQHLNEELTLEQACAAAGCGRVTLQKAFRARLHRSPMEVFAQLRIEAACRLLAQGESPGAVAKRLGYPSGGYFSRRFRAAMGQTPSEYRRSRLAAAEQATNRQTP